MPVKPEGGSNEVCQRCPMWRRGFLEGRDVSGAQRVTRQDGGRIGRIGFELMLMRCHGDESTCVTVSVSVEVEVIDRPRWRDDMPHVQGRLIGYERAIIQ